MSSMNDDWQPGDPLYQPANAWQRCQEMFSIKDDNTYMGARWSPDVGWRFDDDA